MVDASILEKLRRAALKRSVKKQGGYMSFSQESLGSTQPVSQGSRWSSEPISLSQIPVSAQKTSLVSRSVGVVIDTVETGIVTDAVIQSLTVMPLISLEPLCSVSESVQTDAPYPADIPPLEPADDVLLSSDIVLLLSEIHSIVSLYPQPPSNEPTPPPRLTDDVDEDAILELFIRNDEKPSPKVGFARDDIGSDLHTFLEDSPPSTPQVEVWETIIYLPSEVSFGKQSEKRKSSKRKMPTSSGKVQRCEVKPKKQQVEKPMEPLRRSSRINAPPCNPVESLLKRLKHVVQFTPLSCIN